MTKAARSKSASSQFIQEVGLSWQYALLLHASVRPQSSPATTIGILFSVSRVVLAVVRNKSRERHPVMACNEVDARCGAPAIQLIEIRAPRQSKTKVTERAVDAPPIVAHTV